VAFRLALAGPRERDRVLSVDVFDGPATVAFVDRFLGSEGNPDARTILVLAHRDDGGGETVVGFASGVVLDHPDKAPTLFISEIGVNEEARRLGIGRALLVAIRAEGCRRGCQSSWVATEGDNAPARALYTAAGGRETEAVVMYEWDETGTD
jgi:ribosomal protein S18 acetylase RimI-like enzyme